MPGEVHEEMEVMGMEIASQAGFERYFRGETLKWSRSPERPDVWAMALRYQADHPWHCDDPIQPTDTLVLEAKAERPDFLADLEKPHRKENPTLGEWFGYVCPPGVIRKGEIGAGDGLWYVEDGTYEIVQHPQRRLVEDKEKTTFMLVNTMWGHQWGEMADQAPTRSWAKKPKAKRLQGEAAELAAFIDGRPADVGLLKKYARAHRVHLKGSPKKLGEALVACGRFDYEVVEGIPWFKLKEQAGPAASSGGEGGGDA